MNSLSSLMLRNLSFFKKFTGATMEHPPLDRFDSPLGGVGAKKNYLFATVSP